MYDNPYNFIRVDTQFSLTDTPVYHDNDHSQLFSGKLKCSLRLLTPTIVGNYHYRNSENETVIEPMMTADGRAIIPGTSIRGMLRNSIAALCCAPMERVQEQEFGYRPNSKFGKMLIPVPMIIKGKTENGDYNARLFFGNYYFRSKKCTASDEVFCRKKNVGKVYPRNDVDNDFNCIEESVKRSDFTKYTYLGALTIRNYDGIYVQYNNYVDTVLKKEVWEHYLKTLAFLKNHKNGHISSRHPNTVQVQKIRRNIHNVNTIMTKNFNSKVLNKVVFFAEVDKNKNLEVTSMGHHFRYLTRYRDTIHKKRGKPRSEVVPLLCEQTDNKLKLSAARLLFGVSEDSQNIGAEKIGGRDDFHLMGRIYINNAVEIVNNGDSLEERFLHASDDFKTYMNVLNGPKASAVEFYLTQGGLNRSDNGTLRTYGDTLEDKSAGNLRGRKFYYHQSASNSSFSVTKNQFDKTLGSCCRFVSKPGRDFRFTVRYKNLRQWELDLLKFAVKMSSVDCNKLLSAFQTNQASRKAYPDNTQFAHKIGYGRSLGLGSIAISIDNDNSKQNQSFLSEKLLSKLSECLSKQDEKAKRKMMNRYRNLVIIPWLELHRFTSARICRYPRGHDGLVYSWHKTIRDTHLEGRRNTNRTTPTINNEYLPKLELDDNIMEIIDYSE